MTEEPLVFGSNKTAHSFRADVSAKFVQRIPLNIS